MEGEEGLESFVESAMPPGAFTVLRQARRNSRIPEVGQGIAAIAAK
jgi:hypothetical protein